MPFPFMILELQPTRKCLIRVRVQCGSTIAAILSTAAEEALLSAKVKQKKSLKFSNFPLMKFKVSMFQPITECFTFAICRLMLTSG